MSLFFLQLLSDDYSLEDDFGIPISSDSKEVMYLSHVPGEEFDPDQLQTTIEYLCNKIMPLICEKYSGCTGCTYCVYGYQEFKDHHDRASIPPKTIEQYLGSGEYDSQCVGYQETDIQLIEQKMEKHEPTGTYLISDEEVLFSLRSYCKKGGKIENISEELKTKQQIIN